MYESKAPETYHTRDILYTKMAALAIASAKQVESRLPAPLPFDGNDVSGEYEF